MIGNHNNLEELVKELQKKTDEIRAKLGGKKDFGELSESTRAELRLLYTEASRMAKEISKRTTDKKIIEEYENPYKDEKLKGIEPGCVLKTYFR